MHRLGTYNDEIRDQEGCMSMDITIEQILSWIREAGITLEVVEADVATPLSELGVDSLDFFSILEVLEEQSGASISDEAATKLRSIQDLTDYLRAQGTGE